LILLHTGNHQFNREVLYFSKIHKTLFAKYKKIEFTMYLPKYICSLPEEIACGVAGGRQEDAGAAGSPELQGRSEVQGRGRQSYRWRGKEWVEEKKRREKKGGKGRRGCKPAGHFQNCIF
jgi:hypothetical protein